MTSPTLRYALAVAISLRLHPATNCLHCQGTKTHHGAVFGYAHRLCRACGGTSCKPPLGVCLLNVRSLAFTPGDTTP